VVSIGSRSSKVAILAAVTDPEPAPIEEAKAHSFPCPSCGADTVLKPGADALECAHCGHVSKIEDGTAPIHEYDFYEALTRLRRQPANQMTAGGREVMCKNCGARSVVTRQATRCPFCDNAMVVEVEHSEASIVPESVLPFALDKQAAAESFLTWLRSRWFAPFDLVKRAKRDGLDGVYLPYWTYDSDTTTRYVGERGDHYYVTEHYTDSQGKRQSRQVRKTRWHRASGTVQVDFDDVLVCATPSLPRKIIEQLEPWDLPELKPFDGKYLAGFTAERYRIELEDGFKIADERMEPKIRSAIRDDIGGDEQRIHRMSVKHDNVTFKHVLLPLWISSFRYGERVFRVTVNARTGEVAGERPWSWFKILLLIVVILGVIGLVIYLRSVS
jgi:ribosomal protein L37AE/L43A